MHAQYLQQALAMAETRRGFCAPNPSVGAVVVKEGVVLSTGCHWQAGSAHAEVDALNKLTKEQTQNATLYVTLEPCCHYGKTPPCINAIIAAGITSVYFAMRDPNPKVSGAGQAGLIAAGIHADLIEVLEITEFYASYNYWWQHKRPMLTAKIALSLDGKLAGTKGQQVAITSETTRIWTHQQRLRSDAILSTSKTVHMDDPSFNVRLNDEVIGKPVYLLDTQCALSPNAKILTTAKPLYLLSADTASKAAKQAWHEKGVEVLSVSSRAGRLDLSNVLDLLGERGLFDVWLECGARALAAFLQAELIQVLHVCIAPKFLGSSSTQAELPAWNFVGSAKQISVQSSGVDTIYTMKL